MIRLFTSYYIDSSQSRQKEINQCLKRNIDNKHIDEIVLLIEYPIDLKENIHLMNKKIKTVLIHSRPFYNVFFNLINDLTGPKDWNIIANSDIFFDETIALIDGKYSDLKRICLALTRWDVQIDGKVNFLNQRDSQDTWVAQGQILKVDGDFMMGQPGCDNAIAERFKRVGYSVINPSKTIKTYHLHNSGVRNYNPNNKVPQPYYLIQPTA